MGGRIETGTPLEKNLAREIREETKLMMTGIPKLIAAQDILRIPGKHVVRLTYLANAKGKIKLDPEEADECGWFSTTEIRAMKGLDRYLKELVGKGVLDGRD